MGAEAAPRIWSRPGDKDGGTQASLAIGIPRHIQLSRN